MNKYKRITKVTNKQREIKGVECDFSKCRLCGQTKIIKECLPCCLVLFKRLKDLEDKIESGELLFRGDLK